MRLLALLLATLSPAPLLAASLPPSAPLPVLAAQVKLPYGQFTLDNGLRVVVSTDHKAPIVAVSIWYHVGSKDEPAGKTGFAHLFEHLMFYGSENVPGGIFAPLEKVGATDMNGTTYFDRTNYFETVPTPALPLALFLESDRMGHLLGAVGQQTLDRQRGVVQNEKRQDDDQPYGLVEYSQLDALFPAGHPYHHTTLGSMADLDRASLEDVRAWFRGHYGPNNAVLVLAGDIDLAAARALVTRYFGDIPRGPQPVPTPAPVPTLAAPKVEVLHDQVATVRVLRDWAVPGVTDKDTVPLDLAGSILGGLASSRLDNILVRQEKLAVSVSAGLSSLERVGEFEVSADVKPGIDPALVGRRIDAIVADFLANGPTADELQRAVTQEVSGRLFQLEHVGGFSGKATVLAEGALYAGDPGFAEKQLAAYAAATPASVRAAARTWLSRPVYALTVEPGTRPPQEEAKASAVNAANTTPAVQAVAASGAAPAAKPARIAPEVGEIADLTFPPVARAALSNGIRIVYARRAELPLTRIAFSFDAGYAADPTTALGTGTLALGLFDEGTTTRSAADIAADQERLGSRIAIGNGMDRADISLSAMTVNLVPSLDLLADVTLNPSFADIERLRVQQLTGIRTELSDPSGLAMRTLPGLIYGPGHPYGVPASGLGDPAAVARLTKADLVAFKDRWVRPETATIFIVSDLPLATIQPLLERRFGAWRGSRPPAAKAIDRPIPAPAPRIVLFDRPGAAQSVIVAGEVLAAKGTEELLPLLAANEEIGGGITSRLNVDIRETRNWSYGVDTAFSRYVGRIPYILSAPVQTDATGPAIAAMRADMTGFLTSQPMTPAERDRTIQRNIRQLPGSFETGAEVIGGMQRNDLLKRPDDYYSHVAGLYRALTVEQIEAAARAQIRVGDLTWVVVGDAAKVKPQLATLGLPVEVAKPPAAQ